MMRRLPAFTNVPRAPSGATSSMFPAILLWRTICCRKAICVSCVPRAGAMVKGLAGAICFALPRTFSVIIGASALPLRSRGSRKKPSVRSRAPTLLNSTLKKCLLALSIACAPGSDNCSGSLMRKGQHMPKSRRLPDCERREFAFCCIVPGGSWPTFSNNARRRRRKDHEFVLLRLGKGTGNSAPPRPLAASWRSGSARSCGRLPPLPGTCFGHANFAKGEIERGATGPAAISRLAVVARPTASPEGSHPKRHRTPGPRGKNRPARLVCGFLRHGMAREPVR